MSLFNQIEGLANRFLGEWVPSTIDSHGRFLEMLNSSRSSVLIVAGELDPSFYCGRVAKILEEKLTMISTFTVSILFHKACSRADTIGMLKSGNRQLVSLFTKPEYRGRVRLFWASERPRFHFIVADTSTLLEQKDHPPAQRRDVYIRPQDNRMSAEYRHHFDVMTKAAQVLELQPEEFS